MSLKLFNNISERIMFACIDVNLLKSFAKLFNIELYTTIIKSRQIGRTDISSYCNSIFWETSINEVEYQIKSDYIKSIKDHYRKQKSNDFHKHLSKFLKLKCFV